MVRLLGKLTYSNVMSTVAVFGVLAGGAAYAGSKIGSSDIKASAIKSKHIANGALRAIDFAAGQLPAGPQGSQGPAGPQGSQGVQGPPGNEGNPAASLFAAHISDLPAVPGGTEAVHGGPISGLSTAVAVITTNDVNDVTMLSPPVAIVARDLTVRLTRSPSGGTRRVMVRDDLETAYLSCTVNAADYACSNRSDANTIPANTALYLEVITTASGTAGEVVSTDALVTWRATAS